MGGGAALPATCIIANGSDAPFMVGKHGGHEKVAECMIGLKNTSWDISKPKDMVALAFIVKNAERTLKVWYTGKYNISRGGRDENDSDLQEKVKNALVSATGYRILVARPPTG